MKLKFEHLDINNDKLLDLHLSMLKPRMIEEKMLLLLRQGRISKWFSGIGQEAISSAVVNVLSNDEFILPMHRNLGVFTGRKIKLSKLFSQFQGKSNGFTNGRDRSFHFGSLKHHIVGMISHLGPQMGVASGIALANKIEKNNKITLVYTGEGGTSEGDFHEALNVASVWSLPVIFLIENNGYGLSTPTPEQYKCENLADRAIGYGMESHVIDGNNIMEMYSKLKTIHDNLKLEPRPVLIECKTFRIRGHEEASGTKYVPSELIDYWSKKDPVENFEKFLLKHKKITKTDLENFKINFKKEIDEAVDIAFNEPSVESNISKELKSVYKDFDPKIVSPSKTSSKLRFIDSISSALSEGMKKHKKLIFMGQDIAEYGGVFKISDGFLQKFGKERIRNTPICESIILSMGLGLSVAGYKSIIEMQFADFVSSGFNAVVNNLAKSHYRWQQCSDVVVRMPCGAGVGAGPFHSQTNEAWFTHTPGLKVVYPSSPIDAKGLLLTAIEDPNPVMFFEHKALYRSISEQVPEGYFTIPFGNAKIVESGTDLSIITYGLGVHWALDFIRNNENISIDLIDLRTLVPLDKKSIDLSVKKTGKVLILHEDTQIGGFGSDIASYISENLFEYLDAPIHRVSSLDTPVPFAENLEKIYLANDRLSEAIDKIYKY